MSKQLYMAGLLLLSVTVSAQNYKMFSVRAGGGLSTATFPDVVVSVNGQSSTERVTSVYTYMAGVGFNLPLGGRVSLQPELIYLRKGYELQYRENQSSIRDRYYLNTIQVPLFLKVMFARERFRFFCFVGPAVDYSLNGVLSKITTTGNAKTTDVGKVVFSDGSTNAPYYFDTAKFNQLDVSVQGGVAAGTRLGTGLLLVELRGGLGLIDFNKDEQSKFRTSMITLSYGIPIGSVGNSR